MRVWVIKWFLLGVGCHGPEGWGSIRPRVVPAWIWGGPKLGVGTNPVVGGPCLCFGTKQRVCGREYRVAVEDGQQRGCMAPGASPACWDEVGDRTPLCTVWRGKGERMPHGMLLHGEAWTYLQAITPAGRQGCQGRYGPLPARGTSLWGSPAWPHHILHPIPHGMLGTVRGGCHPCSVTVPGLSPSHTDAHRGRAAPKGGGTECPRAQQAPSLKGPRAEGAAQGAGVAGPWGPCSASAPHQGPPPAAGPRQGPCRGGGRGVSEAWHRDGHSYWGSRPLPASVVGCGAAAALPMPLPAPMGALGNLPCPGLLLAWVTHG